MASNSFGELFKITTFGESHGMYIGVVVDGCPPGLVVKKTAIDKKLARRRPGLNRYVSSRSEPDTCEIVSGVFEDKTTGAPITILIKNREVQSDKYHLFKDIYRPGHANFTYLHKYGVFDYRGGGRASARETACRVAAGAVAEQILARHKIKVVGYIKSVGDIESRVEKDFKQIQSKIKKSVVYCPDNIASARIINLLQRLKKEGDSIGGVIEFIIDNLPVGLGDPIYQKLEARLAYAMMSIPGSRGFEIGDGFNISQLRGSQGNDLITYKDCQITFKSNHGGGVLGGISNGMPVIGRVVFKATSSIFIYQPSINIKNKKSVLKLPSGSRHDTCIAIRAVPVVEAMCSLVVADAIISNASLHLTRDKNIC